MPRRSQKNASRRKARKSVRKSSKFSAYASKSQKPATNNPFNKDTQVTAPGSALEFRAPRFYLKAGPFQQSLFTKMRYCESFVCTTDVISGLSIGPLRLSLTSIWDPNLQVGGHQPYGRDEIAAVYKSYTTYGVRIIITSDCSNITTGANGGACLCLRLTSSISQSVSMAGQTIEDFREKAGCLVWDGEQSGAKLDLGYMSIADIEGVDKAKVMNDNVYAAAVVNSPLLQPELQLFLSSNTGAGAALGALRRYNVLIDYYVKFWNPATLPQS